MILNKFQKKQNTAPGWFVGGVVNTLSTERTNAALQQEMFDAYKIARALQRPTKLDGSPKHYTLPQAMFDTMPDGMVREDYLSRVLGVDMHANMCGNLSAPVYICESACG